VLAFNQQIQGAIVGLVLRFDPNQPQSLALGFHIVSYLHIFIKGVLLKWKKPRKEKLI
jgi:hypothetical protein